MHHSSAAASGGNDAAAGGRAEPLRVLIVDDDPVYRRVLSQTLERMDGVEVIGVSPGLELAQSKLERNEADVITLDVTLGTESGLTMLEWLHRRPTPIGAILVTAGTPDVRTEVDAILLGAVGLVIKPGGPDAQAVLTEQLARNLAKVTRRRSVAEREMGPALPIPCAARRVIAVGASTGGPPVLLNLLRTLPAGFDTPVVIVQHMPIAHLGYFAELLAAQTGRAVALAQHDEPIEHKRIYLAAGGKHLTLAQRQGRLCVQLIAGPEEHNCCPAVDPLFRSVADTCGPAAVGVVISGMGADGAAGAAAMRARGAPIVVQDEATSVVWGMPGATVAAGAADVVAPGDRLATWIARWTR